MPAPLRPIRVKKPENEVNPKLELPEEDQEDNELNHGQLIEQLTSGIPQLELLEEEEEEVLETDPGVQAEIDNNPEPALFEPTPYDYEEGSSDYDSDSDNSNNPMTAPAA